MTNDKAFAMYIAQHFYVHDKEYTSSSNAVTDNESGYFYEEELSKSEEQECEMTTSMQTYLTMKPTIKMKSSLPSALQRKQWHNPY